MPSQASQRVHAGYLNVNINLWQIVGRKTVVPEIVGHQRRGHELQNPSSRELPICPVVVHEVIIAKGGSAESLAGVVFQGVADGDWPPERLRDGDMDHVAALVGPITYAVGESIRAKEATGRRVRVVAGGEGGVAVAPGGPVRGIT